ncbi:MAG: GNAT family N-acetyltransferase [Oligoflexia bacterium]|nr:GNAT family N-acetyltransferase [Oligoflexia bacterium]
MNLILRQLNENDEQAFLEGAKEWGGESPHWYSFIWKEGMAFKDMLEILHKENEGIDLAPDRVPHTMLYGFLDSKIVGRVSVRHELNDYLRKRGGHIGYSVAKRFRNKGYATEMVRQAIEFCKNRGMKSIMITCADNNIPSWKIIERFGGTLQDQVWDEEESEMLRRYWITI